MIDPSNNLSLTELWLSGGDPFCNRIDRSRWLITLHEAPVSSWHSIDVLYLSWMQNVNLARTCLPLPAIAETTSTVRTEWSESESFSSSTVLTWSRRVQLQTDAKWLLFLHLWHVEPKAGQSCLLLCICLPQYLHFRFEFPFSGLVLKSGVFFFKSCAGGFFVVLDERRPLCLHMLTSSWGFFSSFSRLFNCCFVISFDLHISMAFCNDKPFCLSSLPFKSLSFTPMTSRSRINSSVNAPNSQDEASFRSRLT